MTADTLATIQFQLADLAERALEIEGLDAFVDAAGDSPDGAELRELAVAAAEFQRVARRQTGG